MSTASYKINGRSIKRPSSFKIERYNVTNMQRLANADMAGDLLAKKIKLYFTYDSISASDLNNILEAIWNSDKIFFPATYVENGKEKTITVYVGSIPTELYRTGSEWYWQNVTFNLIQQ